MRSLFPQKCQTRGQWLKYGSTYAFTNTFFSFSKKYSCNLLIPFRVFPAFLQISEICRFKMVTPRRTTSFDVFIVSPFIFNFNPLVSCLFLYTINAWNLLAFAIMLFESCPNNEISSSVELADALMVLSSAKFLNSLLYLLIAFFPLGTNKRT